eukprot:4621122-Pyramimonas_sp.AAC.1
MRSCRRLGCPAGRPRAPRRTDPPGSDRYSTSAGGLNNSNNGHRRRHHHHQPPTVTRHASTGCASCT